MTPTPAWYEADSADSDRNAPDDNTPSTTQEPRGAILPAVEPARGFSDADLLRRRTAALNRTSAENERLRAEVRELHLSAIDEARDTVRQFRRAEAAEAKLRDVEALADEWERRGNSRLDEESAAPQNATAAVVAIGGTEIKCAVAIRAVLARPQEPAPECDCPCDTHAQHVARYPDLAPRGDDLPDLVEGDGSAMTVTWGQP